MAQAAINVAAALGAISGPLIMGALTETNVKDGWRNFYVRLTRFLYTVLTIVSVDSDGTLGSDRCRYLRWLQTTKKAYTT